MSITPSTGNINNASFNIKSNNPPHKPSDPIPLDGATNVSIYTNLCWTGGDPDGDLVVYDVYFGKSNPPPLILMHQTDNCTYLCSYGLEFNKKYFWKIIALDKYGSTDGPIWSFTTQGNSSPVPKVDCYGVNLDFSDVDPGAYVIGQIRIQNIGDVGSFLNWKIDNASTPTWGTWIFIPDSGTNLSQGYNAICDIEVQVTNKEGEYTGTITVCNVDDPTDYCVVCVSGSIIIPRNRATLNSLFQLFFVRFPLLEVFLRAMNLLK